LPVEFHFRPALAAFLFVAALHSLTMARGSFNRRAGAEGGNLETRGFVQDFQILRRGITRANERFAECRRRNNDDVLLLIEGRDQVLKLGVDFADAFYLWI